MKQGKLLPDAAAIYLWGVDSPYVSGDHFPASPLKIFKGRGPSAWVAENRRPIVDANPAMERGYRAETDQCAPQRSALSVPVDGPQSTVGVITLYRADEDAFSLEDHSRDESVTGF